MLLNKKHRNLALIGGIFASVVSAVMGISVYSGVNPGIQGLLTAILIFGVIEILAILSAVTLFNPQMPGHIRGFAALLLIACISTEVFVTANEMQGGVLKKMESAKANESTSAGATAAAGALVAAQKGIAECNARYPRAKRDAAARDACNAPFQSSLNAATPVASATVVEFSADNAAEKSKWQSLADWYNSSKLPEDKITPDQAAFAVFLALGIIIAFGKVFLYAIHGNSDENATVPYPQLPPTGTDGDSRNSYRDGGYSSNNAGFSAPVTARHDSPTPRAYDAGISYRATTLDTPAPHNNAPRNHNTASSAVARAASIWGMDGNAALDKNSTTSTVPGQFEAVQDSETEQKMDMADRQSPFYVKLLAAVKNREVRPTVRPIVEKLREFGASGSNSLLKDEIAPLYIRRMLEEGVIYHVPGRTERHPRGMYEVA